jgi:hypothetical protein
MTAKPKKLLPEDLHSELLDYVIDHNFPVELYEISSHTIITGISDVEFTKVERQGSGALIEGTATVEVQLNYGGGASADGVTSNDSYPLSFKVSVDDDGKIESGEVSVDTSSFYE